MSKSHLGKLISELEFSQKEVIRITEKLKGASLNKIVFENHAKKSQTYKNYSKNKKFSGMSPGRPAHTKMVLEELVKCYAAKEIEGEERFWKVYRSAVIDYITTKQKKLQKLLMEVSCRGKNHSSEDLIQMICENAKHYKINPKAIEELYELWGFERVEDLNALLSLCEKEDLDQEEKLIEPREADDLPFGLPKRFCGKTRDSQKLLKEFLGENTQSIKLLFKKGFIKEYIEDNLPQRNDAMKGNTLECLQYLYSIPNFRENLYLATIENVSEKGEEAIKKMVVCSFEYQAIRNYKESPEKEKYNESALQDLFKENQAIPFKIENTLSRDDFKNEDAKDLYKKHLMLWKFVKKDLKKWSLKNAEERQAIINIIFSLGTLFDSTAPIRLAIKLAPELKEEFKDLLETETKNSFLEMQQKDAGETTRNEESLDSTGRKPTWEDLSKQLLRLAELISKEKPSLSTLTQLNEVVGAFPGSFPSDEKNEGTASSLEACLIEFGEELVDYGKRKKLDWFNETLIGRILEQWNDESSGGNKNRLKDFKQDIFEHLKDYDLNEQEKNIEVENIREIELDRSAEVKARKKEREIIKISKAAISEIDDILEDIENYFLNLANSTHPPQVPPHSDSKKNRAKEKDNSTLEQQSRPDVSEDNSESLEIFGEDNMHSKDSAPPTPKPSSNDLKNRTDAEYPLNKAIKKKKETFSEVKSGSVSNKGVKPLDFKAPSEDATNGFLCAKESWADPVGQSNVFWYMIKEGQLHYAYWFIKSLENSDCLHKELPCSALVKAMALANKIYDPLDDVSLTYERTLQEILNDENRVRELIDHSPRSYLGIRLLLIVAFLQPAFNFASKYHISLSSIKKLNQYLDEDLIDILQEIINFVQENKVGLSLRDFKDISQIKEGGLKSIQLRVKELVAASNEKKGDYWEKAPVNDLLNKGEFKIIVDSIRKNDHGSVKKVKAILAQFPTRDSIINFLNSNHQRYKISKTEHHIWDYNKAFRSNAVNKCQEILNEGENWIKTCPPNSADELKNQRLNIFVENFNKAFSKVRKKRSIQEGLSSLANGASINLILNSLNSIHNAINGKGVSFKYDINAWINLPIRLTGEQDFKSEAPSIAIALAKIARTKFDLTETIRTSIKSGDINLASILINELKEIRGSERDVGNFESDLDKERKNYLKKAAQKIGNMKSKIDDAFEHGAIDNIVRADMYSEVGILEEENQSGANPSFPEINKILKNIDHALDIKKSDKLRPLEKEFEELKLEFNNRDDLSGRKEIENYRESISKSLNSKNITVSGEKIASFRYFLNNPDKPLHNFESYRLLEFEDFLNKQEGIYKACKEFDPKIIRNKIHNDRPVGPLDFSSLNEKPTSIIKSWDGLSSSSPSKNLDQNHKNQIRVVLNGLGFKSDPKIDIGDGPCEKKIAAVELQLKVATGESPFPIFGSASNGKYIIICSWHKTAFSQINLFLNEHSIQCEKVPIILLSFNDFSPEDRSEFTQYCHNEKLSLLIIDRVVFLYILSLDEGRDESRLRTTFKITLPFTYNNPYQLALRPPSSEMVFGREEEIKDVIDFPGTAIIYGGRQLGKSTILQEALARFHDPESSHYSMRGGSIKHYQGKNLEYIRSDFWGQIGKEFIREGLLDTGTIYTFEDICSFLRSRPELKILIAFDEVDEFLIEDDKNRFAICSDLRQLSQDANGSFKVLMVGLLSVQRYAERPNVPLAQLGGVRRVGMLHGKDARDLIQIPSAYAGYSYDDDAVDTILAHTNRHPGLIQVFCYHLLEYLRQRKKIKAHGDQKITVPGYIIKQADISAVYRKQEIRDHIKDRFILTLTLNDHWKILIYSLINAKLEMGFNATQAKEVGEEWWPEGFKGKNPTIIRTYLDEMVGLGVLSQKEGMDRHYCLRSPNIKPHLGSQDDIENELLMFESQTIPQIQKYNHRAYSSEENVKAFSPLTEVDELVISGNHKKTLDREPHVHGSSDKFTVTSIFGSDALGLTSIRNAMQTLGEFEGHKLYKVIEFPKTLSSSKVEIMDWIKNKIKDNKNNPVVLIGNMPTSPKEPKLQFEILDEVQRTLGKKTFEKNVRLIFLFNPKATWEWLGLKDFLYYEERMEILSLNRWGLESLKKFLFELKALHTNAHVEHVSNRTGGWFELIKEYPALLARSGDDPINIKGIEKKLPMNPLLDYATNMLEKQGLTVLPFAIPVLRTIIELGGATDIKRDDFDACIDLLAQQSGLDTVINSKRAIEWYLRMAVIEPISGIREKGEAESWNIEEKTRVFLEVT
jgi:hypothetical protein